MPTGTGGGADLDENRMMLQQVVDALFADSTHSSRMDAVVRAEALDVPEDLLGIIALLPPGTHSRQRMCDQLNSALTAHGWTGRYATVE
jgi:hypothetical protein